MADSQQNIDWDAVRGAALDCVNATWEMICFAGWSQGGDYDVERAALHLAVIDRARDTFRRAMEVLQPGFECSADDSIRYSPVFDLLALATVGEGARPDFRFGPVCCATAHEAAFALLRRAILWVESGLNDELDEGGLPDEYVAGINDLHKLSPEALRDTLARLEKRNSLQNLIAGRSTHQVRAWIDREWAAVSHTTCREEQPPAAPAPVSQPPAAVPQYVTLGMMGAIVQRSPRTLEKWKARLKNPLPPPDIEGGGGKPDEWEWSRVRPWLQEETGRRLPDPFPTLQPPLTEAN